MADALPPPLVHKRRTPLKRGAAALVLAPALAIIPLGVVLLLVFNLGPEGGCVTRSIHSQFQELIVLALALVGPTLLFGPPTWAILRFVRRESGLAYTLAGLLEGLLCAFYVGYSGTGAIRIDQALAFGLLSAAGGGIAFAFWRLARDPKWTD